MPQRPIPFRSIRRMAFVAGILIAVSEMPHAQVHPEQDSTVYITRHGSAYHRDSCMYLSKSKIAISLRDAKKYYHPCKVCRPDQRK